MTWQIHGEQLVHAGGGNYLALAHAEDFELETGLSDDYITIVFGCGYVNVYDGWLSDEDICGDHHCEPIASAEMWRIAYADAWDDDGCWYTEDGRNTGYEYRPDCPYWFYCDELRGYSIPVEMFWFWYHYMDLNRL